MILSIVVAIAENYAIGKDNQLLWHLPADLKHFKTITSGHTIIMGRKTYDSIGKPLPNRRNIVVTRNQDLVIPGTEVCNSLQEAIAQCQQETEVFLIGGAQLYQEGIDLTNRIYLTRVHQNFDADSYFPEIDPLQWEESDIENHHPDEKNRLAYTFSTLDRK